METKLLVKVIGALFLGASLTAYGQGSPSTISGSRPEVVVDQKTGLMWQKQDAQLTENRYFAWAAASEYVETMNQKKFAGYDDWRLPTLNELRSLWDPKKPNKDKMGKPLGLSPEFPSGGGWAFWSADSRNGAPCFFQFSDGRVYCETKFSGSVRLARRADEKKAADTQDRKQEAAEAGRQKAAEAERPKPRDASDPGGKSPAAPFVSPSGVTFLLVKCDISEYKTGAASALVNGLLPKGVELSTSTKSGQYYLSDRPSGGIFPILEEAKDFAEKQGCRKQGSPHPLFLSLDLFHDELPRHYVGYWPHPKNLALRAGIEGYPRGLGWGIKNLVADRAAAEAQEKQREDARARVIAEQKKRVQDEADRKAQDQREIDRLAKQWGVAAIPGGSSLNTNPFAYEGKVVMLVTGFVRMETATTALFYWPELIVSDVPKGTFTNPQDAVVLAGKVLGRDKKGRIHLKFVGVHFCEAVLEGAVGSIKWKCPELGH